MIPLLVRENHDSRLRALLLIQTNLRKTKDPLEYCWLVRIEFRLTQSLRKENCDSGIGLIQNFRNEGAHRLAIILCGFSEPK